MKYFFTKDPEKIKILELIIRRSFLGCKGYYKDKVEEAIGAIKDAHKDQTRRDGRSPYYYHLIRVAFNTNEFLIQNESTSGGSRGELVVTALLHDLLEDTPYNTKAKIRRKFGYEFFSAPIYKRMKELTNIYTKENFPDLNRESRKLLEFGRLGSISEPTKIIKILDRIDNLTESYEDEDHWKGYVEESKTLLKVLQYGGVKELKPYGKMLDEVIERFN